MDQITSTNLKIQSKYSSSSASKSIFYSPHMHVLPLLYIQCYHWIEHAGYRYKYKYKQVLISTLLLKIWILSESNVILSLLCSMIFLSFVLFLFSVDLRPLHCIYWKLFRIGSGWMNLFEPIIITIMQWPRSWIKGQSRISLLTLQTSGDQLIQRSMFSISISIFSNIDVCWWLDAVQ